MRNNVLALACGVGLARGAVHHGIDTNWAEGDGCTSFIVGEGGISGA
jgi:hypothetical protein